MTLFSYEPVAREQVAAVVEALWERGREELRRFKIPDPQQVIEQVMAMAHDYGWVFKADGVPVAVCGAHGIADVFYTWFLATEELEKVGRPFTLWLRRFTREIMATEGRGKRLEIHSALVHPQAARWFEALGFREFGHKGIFHYFEYVRETS